MFNKCNLKNNTTILLFVNNVLKLFFKDCIEIDKIITTNQELPIIDFYISLISLPYIFRNNRIIPKPYKFFSPNKKISRYWKLKLKKTKKIKIGLFWQGDNVNNQSDFKRSIELKKFKPIFNLQNI